MNTYQQRRAWNLALAGFFSMAALLLAPVPADAQTAAPQRVGFQILTGSTSGTYFRVGELLAGLLSHPPGISRCEAPYLCGPAGLIVSTRATQGSVANLVSVNAGTANSGLAQADVLAMAVAGEGPFALQGPARQLRTITGLYGEDLHIAAARKANILRVADLRGKRVSLSTEGSGTIVTARAVLAAYRLPEWRLVANYENADRAAALMREGRLDAFFFVGGAPVNLIAQLLDDQVAVLVPVDGEGRRRLLAQQRHLAAHTMLQGTYRSSPSVETVGIVAHWVINASQPEDLVYGMVRALYNPRNRAMIEARRVGYEFFSSTIAARNPVAPLHPGAARYFREVQLLPAR